MTRRTPTDGSEDVAARSALKAEVHVHLEGTISHEAALGYAFANGLSVARLPEPPAGGPRNFADFLHHYRAYSSVLRTALDFERAADAYLGAVAPSGVRHVEFAIDVAAHAARAVTIESIVAGVTRAFAGHGHMSGGVIATFDRATSAPAAEALVDEILRHGSAILGVGVAGAEDGQADGRFRRAFQTASSAGLLVTVHAGRRDFIAEAIDDPAVHRIDHGFRVVEDAGLLDAARQRGMHFALAPVTNVLIGPVGSLREHPLLSMIAAGLSVSLNSDDPALLAPYDVVVERVRRECGLDSAAMARLFDASLEHAWVSEIRRAQLRGLVDASRGS